MKYIIFAGTALVIVLLALVMIPRGGAAIARGVIFQPPADVKTVSLSGLPRGGEIMSIKTGDGLTLKGLVFRGDGEGDLFLMFHGNASTAQHSAMWLQGLIDQGHSVIFAEYRGYSGNPGKPSEAGTALDADAWSRFAFDMATKEHHNQRVFYIGHSLGGGVAFQAAMKRPPHALITIGTFTDTPSFAPQMSASLVADRYDNEAKLTQLQSSYYILHGTADTVIPVSHGQALWTAAGQAGLHGGAFFFHGEGHDPKARKIIEIIDYIVTTDMKSNAQLPDRPGLDARRFLTLDNAKSQL